MKKILFIILSISVLCMGFVIYKLITPEKMNLEPGGYGLGLIKEDGSLEDYSININQRDHFNVKITNSMKEKNKFLMNVYINYEKVDFKLVGNNELLTNYELNLSGESAEVVSIEIPKDRLIYHLNPIVIELVAAPNEHASASNTLAYTDGVTARYDLINDHKSSTANLPEAKEVSPDHLIKTKSNEFGGILLNADTTNISQFNSPDVKIYSKPNQEVEFAIRAGGVNQAKSYLVWVNLQHDQVLINNQKYLHFKTPHQSVAFEKISFKAPAAKGKYEIYAYLVQNPWESIDSKGVLGTMIHPSERITLHVE